ncbi:sugar phosphotransferase component II B [Salmonella enterica subsp. enterica]|uniref:Sugar phosphotransferase component II B n=1 Tax=Salmonella enterica I TaxID=59201 RepID=A0A447PDG0_SALET|nr:sugar phosphotransferase component II B [Salmonella enterica subsp. enterica]
MKIMAICGSGLGSSFMVEMNIKKVLKKLNIDAEVEHSDLSSATPGAADLFCNGQRYRGQRQRTGKPTGGDQ